MFRTLKNRKRILESINGITQTHKNIIEFGDVVHDYSEQHRNKKVALKFGFKDTPVIGVHSAAIGGRIARNILSAMNSPKEKLYFTHQDITFREAIYPEEPINWELTEGNSDKSSKTYILVVPNEEKGVKSKIEMTCKFGATRPRFEEKSIDDLVYKDRIKIIPEEVKRFYMGLRESPVKEVPFSLGIARIPSTLLRFQGELNDIHHTNIGGKNLNMKSKSFEDLREGEAEIEIYEIGRKGRGNKIMCIFEGILYQDGKPKVGSTIKTIVNGEIPTRTLRPRYGLPE